MSKEIKTLKTYSIRVHRIKEMTFEVKAETPKEAKLEVFKNLNFMGTEEPVEIKEGIIEKIVNVKEL